MQNATILTTGIVETAIAALSCATPVLVSALGAIGLSAWVGGLDDVLLPARVLLPGMTARSLWRRRRTAATNFCVPAG